MHIAVDGNNFFHTGWLACFFGLPRAHPSARALKAGDLAAFEEGWDTCDETPATGYPCRMDAFLAMRAKGQADVCWSDEGD